MSEVEALSPAQNLEPSSTSSWVGFACVLLTGVLTFGAFPTAASPDLNLWWMIWFSHVPLLWWLKGQTPRQGFWWAYLCGIIINTGGYYWIAELIQSFGHLPLPIALLGLALHSLLVGLIWGVWGYIVCALTPRWGRLLIVPLAMMSAELVMPRIFEAHMGDSQYPAVIIMQIADLFGVTAVTGLIYAVNAALAEALDRRFRPLLIACGLIGLSLGYGYIRMSQIDTLMEQSETLKIGLVEGDIGIFESETKDKRKNHLLIQQRLSAQLVEQGAELIVWPESSLRSAGIPANLESFYRSTAPLVSSYREDEQAGLPRRDRITPLRGFTAPLLFGANGVDRGKTRVKYYNRAWLVSETGKVLGSYDKVHRLVFGEYIPFGDLFPIFYDWLPAASRTEQGEGVKSLTLPHKGRDVRLGLLNCYEGIIPSFNRALLKTDPDVLINLTNDDWFAATAERYLHFALALPRSIESRRYFLRATLTGVSAIIDANGRILKWTSTEEAETLLHDVALMRPWTLYSSIGDTLPYSALVFIAVALWKRRDEAIPSDHKQKNDIDQKISKA